MQEEVPESGRRVPWYPLTWRWKALPLEPLLMVLLTFVGINAELWAGHKSYRYIETPIRTCSISATGSM